MGRDVNRHWEGTWKCLLLHLVFDDRQSEGGSEVGAVGDGYRRGVLPIGRNSVIRVIQYGPTHKDVASRNDNLIRG